MKQYITIKIVGIIDISEDEPRDIDVVDLLARTLTEHFPELKPAPGQPPVTVTIDYLRGRSKSDDPAV